MLLLLLPAKLLAVLLAAFARPLAAFATPLAAAVAPAVASWTPAAAQAWNKDGGVDTKLLVHDEDRPEEGSPRTYTDAPFLGSG